MGAPEEVVVGDPEEASRRECIIPNGLLKNYLVAASVGAGAIHLWAAWQHFNFTRVLVFFVVVAAMQLWLASVVLWIRSVPWSLLIGGAVANAGVVVVWVLTRTTGMPGYPQSSHMDMDKIMERAAQTKGPSHGFITHKETFGFLDTTCSLLEIGVVVAVLMLVLKVRRDRAADASLTSTTGNE
jgi:hypothetical protein